MVEVRISRQTAEVTADSGDQAAISRLDVEVAGQANAASTGQALISRQTVEVVGKRPAEAAVSRLDVEVAGQANAASVGQVLISRQTAEVVSSQSPRAALTRFDVEVAGQANAASTGQARISRQTIEALARRGSAGPVVPLALNDDAEVFLHDWADELVLRSSYLTDVAISATGAESRIGQRLKPTRAMDLVWRQTLDEFDANDLSRLDRLYVFLRRLTGDRFAVPLYCDQRVLTDAYLSADTILNVRTDFGRWAVGARIAVVQLDYRGQYLSHTFHLISDLDGTQIILTAPLGVNVAAYSIVLPMMDCEVALEVEALHETSCLAAVTLTVDEVPGPSSLPPTKTDTPTGAPTHRGIPILDVDPDWTEGVRRGRSRQGTAFAAGRGRGVDAQAARSREVHTLHFTNERDDYWRLVEHFDTRRGRLRTFWHIDQERIWTAAQIDPTFVSIEQFGNLDDVQEELEGAQVGIVLADGTFYVRDVTTVEQVATVYRMTVDPVLPTIDADDVIRVARARMVRLDSDEMEERWSHAGLAQTDFVVIETLEHKDVELL